MAAALYLAKGDGPSSLALSGGYLRLDRVHARSAHRVRRYSQRRQPNPMW
jgi:hypothetical protein